jgi:hypothetical protein
MKILRSILAVLIGMLFIFITHVGTDTVLEALKVFPPPEQGLHVTWMAATALAYRTLFSIAGCYLTARIAPSRPMLHSLILGTIGLLLSVLGTIVNLKMDLSPMWYPIALVVVSLPCAWLGGWLARRGSTRVAAA